MKTLKRIEQGDRRITWRLHEYVYWKCSNCKKLTEHLITQKHETRIGDEWKTDYSEPMKLLCPICFRAENNPDKID